MSAAGNTSGIDADTLALLTDEERAAIEDPEYSPEEIAAMKGIAGEGGEDDEDDEDEDGGEGAEVQDNGKAADDGGKKAGEGETDDGKGKVADPEPEPAPANAERTEATRYQAELPADYQEQVDKLKADRTALKQQFKDGEIDFDAYNEKLEALDEKADELKDMKREADLFDKMNAQSAEQEWKRTLDGFAAEVSKVVDYRKDPEKLSDLDDFIKRLAGNPAHADKPMRWFLDEAHKRVMALHDIKPAAAPKKDEAKPDPKKDREPPVKDAPKTLAHVPGSDGPGDVAGEFADLDSLEGLELEQAIARMTPAQRERYAKS